MKPSLTPIQPEAMPAVERPVPPPTTLAMPNLVATGGSFPARDGGTPACLTMGMVHTSAGGVPVYGAPMAEGQYLPVDGNQALYSIFFANFGAQGDSFGIPALRGRAIVGGIQANQPTATTLPMTWLIAQAPPAGADGPLVGSLAAFGGVFVPDGWLPCDGRMLPVDAQNVALYEVIGNAFGGANPAFALPNLNDLAVYGAGSGGAVGSSVAGPPAGLCFNYLVNTSGPLLATGGDGGFPTNQYWLGQVIAYAGGAVPPDWTLADGSLLNIADYPDLFDLLGHLYGGNGTTNFGLPDLRGKVLVGV